MQEQVQTLSRYNAVAGEVADTVQELAKAWKWKVSELVFANNPGPKFSDCTYSHAFCFHSNYLKDEQNLHERSWPYDIESGIYNFLLSA